MSINTGILLASEKFIKNYNQDLPIKNTVNSEILYIKKDKIINFLEDIDLYNPSEDKLELLKISNEDLSLIQEIMLHYLSKNKPSWVSKFRNGRYAVRRSLENAGKTKDLECLDLTGIFEDDLNLESEYFLMHLEELAYQDDTNENLNNKIIGRKGENYSFQLESKKNPNSKIEKTFLNTNSAGYDLMISSKNESFRFIEVKSSKMDFESCTAHITDTQIQTGLKVFNNAQNEYIFHFWNFVENKAFLAQIPFSEIKSKFHNIGDQKLEGVKLPQQDIAFSLFRDYFKEITF